MTGVYVDLPPPRPAVFVGSPEFVMCVDRSEGRITWYGTFCGALRPAMHRLVEGMGGSVDQIITLRGTIVATVPPGEARKLLTCLVLSGYMGHVFLLP